AVQEADEEPTAPGAAANGVAGEQATHQGDMIMAQRARRGRGESSIFRREEDGLWVATVSLGYDAEGKRKRKTVYGTTKKEVQEKLDELRPAARAGTVGISGMTVAVLLEQWLKASQGTRAVRTSEEW